jgi:hypothetical protein
MERASVVPESDHEVPDLIAIDDDIPDCGKMWYAVLVGKAPGVFDTLYAHSLICYCPLSNAASGPMLLANGSYIAILKQRLGIVSMLLLMRAW